MAEAVIAKKSTTKVIDTWKMKRWYKIISPQLFGSNMVGETVAAEDSQLIGRTASLSLGILTGDMKKQSTNAILEITNVNAGNAETIIKRLEISPSSIRRMIRKGKERIDLSMVCATKDNIIVRIKPFFVTRGKVGGSVLTSMRNLIDAILRVEANKTTYENLIRDIIHGKLQREIKQRLNRLYPVKVSEIRSIEKTIFTGKLPEIPKLPEIREELAEQTEEEKIVKKAKEKEETPEVFARFEREIEKEKEESKLEQIKRTEEVKPIQEKKPKTKKTIKKEE